MSIVSYPAFFYPEPDGSFVAFFPDLTYVFTWGYDFLDTYNMAIDALAGYIDLSRREGDPIESPSDPLTLKPKEGETAFVVVVSVDVDHYIETVFKDSPSEEEALLLAQELEDDEVELPETYVEKLFEILNLSEE